MSPFPFPAGASPPRRRRLGLVHVAMDVGSGVRFLTRPECCQVSVRLSSRSAGAVRLFWMVNPGRFPLRIRVRVTVVSLGDDPRHDIVGQEFPWAYAGRWRRSLLRLTCCVCRCRCGLPPDESPSPSGRLAPSRRADRVARGPLSSLDRWRVHPSRCTPMQRRPPLPEGIRRRRFGRSGLPFLSWRVPVAAAASWLPVAPSSPFPRPPQGVRPGRFAKIHEGPWLRHAGTGHPAGCRTTTTVVAACAVFGRKRGGSIAVLWKEDFE